MAVAKTAAGERLIKRYENRKLYDPAARRYVTMTDLARMIARGEDVQVEDQKSGEDLTTVVLAQVVLETLKQRTAEVPRQVLTRLIRLGSASFAGAASRTAPLDAAVRAREEAERIVSGLLSRGRLSLEEALALKQEIAQSVQRLVTEAQRGLEARLHGLFEPGKGKDATATLDSLRTRLLTFETYLSNAGRTNARKVRR
jgi:polyhydroxyalkanoate synthesis repressor PhaR